MRYLLLLLLAGLSRAALAQAPASEPSGLPHNVLSLNVPIGKPTNLRPQYERSVGRHVSVGLRGAWYFGGAWPGWQAEAVGRYYFRPTAPAGFYVQVQVAYFNHHGIQSYFLSSPPLGLHTEYSAARVSGVGSGFGGGYQLLLGARKHWIIDGMVGLKFYLQPFRGYCDCGYEGDWYDAGPGAVLNSRLGLGYAF